jgi:hypothetical protein
MTGHEAIAPDLGGTLSETRARKIRIREIVFVPKENRLPTIAALRDVMRNARDNDPCRPRHDGSPRAFIPRVFVHVLFFSSSATIRKMVTVPISGLARSCLD